MDKNSPIRFGNYYLVEHIATGGMAEIWRAKTLGVEGFERVVAIKYILPNYTKNPEFNAMFIDEARIASTLNHSNIVRITDFGVIDNKYYHEMELVEGVNLREIRRKAKEKNIDVPIESSCYLISEACKGLHYAHMKHDPITNQPLNIIHRDMSPQNIMISHEGEVKIIDWGIARAKGKVEETRAGVLKGKFGYMSPEQAEGEELDRRTDIFSVGVVLYEILTGERLFVSDSEVNTLKKIREGKIPPPSRVNPNIDKELESIVLKALAKNKIERFQTCFDMHESLVHYLYKKYPTYTSLKLANFIRALFSEEIKDARKRRSLQESSFSSVSKVKERGFARDIEDDQTRVSKVDENLQSEFQDDEEDDRTEIFQEEGEKENTFVEATDVEKVPRPKKAKKKQDKTKENKSKENDIEVKERVDDLSGFNLRSFIKKNLDKILILLVIFFLALAFLDSGEEKKKGEKELSKNEIQEINEFNKDLKEKAESTKKEVVEEKIVEEKETDKKDILVKKEEIKEIKENKTVEEKNERPVAKGPKTGRVNVNTGQIKADFYLNGKYMGKTPIDIKNIVLDKTYNVRIEKEGYRAINSNIKILKDYRSFNFNLEKIITNSNSFLSINSNPPTIIYIDGVKVSDYRPVYMKDLSPGEHKVRLVNKKLGIDYYMEVNLKQGEHKRKQINLN